MVVGRFDTSCNTFRSPRGFSYEYSILLVSTYDIIITCRSIRSGPYRHRKNQTIHALNMCTAFASFYFDCVCKRTSIIYRKRCKSSAHIQGIRRFDVWVTNTHYFLTQSTSSNCNQSWRASDKRATRISIFRWTCFDELLLFYSSVSKLKESNFLNTRCTRW